jgi:hypothetical protein
MPLADVQVEMLAHFVAIDHLAHSQGNRFRALAPTRFDSRLDSPQLLFRRRRQFFPLLRPPLRQSRIPARHQALPGIRRRNDLQQMALVE